MQEYDNTKKAAGSKKPVGLRAPCFRRRCRLCIDIESIRYQYMNGEWVGA